MEWVKTSDLGDPQKAGPCGLPDTNGDNAKLLTKPSIKVTGGSKLHLKVQETVFHSGHYRVALAVNSKTDLPPDPVVAEKWTEKVRTRRGRKFRARHRFRCLLTACSRTIQDRVNPLRSVSIRSRL